MVNAEITGKWNIRTTIIMIAGAVIIGSFLGVFIGAFIALGKFLAGH